MNAVGNVRCSVVILGEHDLTHQIARAMIERINPVTRTHASALAPCKGNQGVEIVRICCAQCRDIGFAGFIRINEIGTASRKAGWTFSADVAEDETTNLRKLHRHHIWIIKIEGIHHLYVIGKLTPKRGWSGFSVKDRGLKLANFLYS